MNGKNAKGFEEVPPEIEKGPRLEVYKFGGTR